MVDMSVIDTTTYEIVLGNDWLKKASKKSLQPPRKKNQNCEKQRPIITMPGMTLRTEK